MSYNTNMGRIDADSGRKRELAHILSSGVPLHNERRDGVLVPQNIVLLPDAQLTMEQAVILASCPDSVTYTLKKTKAALAAPFANLRLLVHHSRDMREEKPMMSLHAIVQLQPDLTLDRADKGFYGDKRRAEIHRKLQESGIEISPVNDELEQGNFLLTPSSQTNIELKLDMGPTTGAIEDMVAKFMAKRPITNPALRGQTPATLRQIEVYGSFYNLTPEIEANELVPGYLEFQRVVTTTLNVFSAEFAAQGATPAIPVLSYKTR
jgi:hypothetical protein